MPVILLFQNCAPAQFDFVKEPAEEIPSGKLQDARLDYEVTPSQNPGKVDILFVVDNSGSMAPEQANMSSRFPGFANVLTGLDWRMAVISTDSGTDKGKLTQFDNQPAGTYFVTPSTTDYETAFKNTVQLPITAGSSTYGDERGIYAANLAVRSNDDKNFFRNEAHLAVVVISDEDERSNGQNLEADDLPQTLIQNVKTKWGASKTLAAHSIIIKPNDANCQGMQSAGGTLPAQYGTVYSTLSTLTKGVIGTVCAADYGAQLAQIGQSIQNSAQVVKLKCVPKPGTLQADWLAPDPSLPVLFHVDGDQFYFDQVPPAGAKMRLQYVCS